MLLVLQYYDVSKLRTSSDVPSNIAIGKYHQNYVQLRSYLMNAYSCNWCFASISAFHNIIEKNIPNLTHNTFK